MNATENQLGHLSKLPIATPGPVRPVSSEPHEYRDRPRARADHPEMWAYIANVLAGEIEIIGSVANGAEGNRAARQWFWGSAE